MRTKAALVAVLGLAVLALAAAPARAQPPGPRGFGVDSSIESSAAGAAPQAAPRAELDLAVLARRVPPVDLESEYRRLEQSRAAAVAAGDDRRAAAALEGLSALYEQQQRSDESLRLAERGLWHAQRADAPELLIALDWRIGRLAQQQGRLPLALAAYRRAVQQVEAIRIDIPVRFQDGRSSFRETLEPIYLALTDLLLQQSGSSSGDERTALLRQARDTVELIKQSELQDFLRDRCSVESARQAQAAVAPGTALYYPIILPDRLELLIETARGIERRSVPVRGDALRRSVLDLVTAMRAGTPLQARSEAMHRWLIAPVEDLLQAERIETLVAVPDGVLRLLPLGALHNGRDFVIQRYAVATAPGLTMTAAARPAAAAYRTLLAGMSEPGPVLDKLSRNLVDSLLDPPAAPRSARGESSETRSLRSAGAPLPPATDTASALARTAALREALALPGVKKEIEDISGVTRGTALLDGSFTLAALKQRLLSREFSVVHIASHGVFGDSADDTFIMTFDELLTLDGLQALLRDPRLRGAPIELITLSACQTAEGDDRAPLGMSGTAIKARARSALGTLWPVSDAAASKLMAQFYRGLAEGRRSKIDALRQAQIELLNNPAQRHPFFWAPFILIGDWS